MEPKKILWISALRGSANEGLGLPLSWTADFVGPEAGIETLRHGDYDAVVLDFPIPEWTAAELLEQVKRFAVATPVFIRDAEATLSDAVRLAHLGAHQFLETGGEIGGQI